MRAVIQRTARCEVRIDGESVGRIGRGMFVLLGIEAADTQDDIDWLCGKITRLRIFDDVDGVMNLDVNQVGGDVMVVSQFTLYASTRKGNRRRISAPRPNPFRARCTKSSSPRWNRCSVARSRRADSEPT